MTMRFGLVVCLLAVGCGGGMPKAKERDAAADVAAPADMAVTPPADMGVAGDRPADQAPGEVAPVDGRDGGGDAGDGAAPDRTVDGTADAAADVAADQAAPADGAADLGAGDAADAGMCIPSGQECTTTCCAGSLCAGTTSGVPKQCALICTVAGECSTNCCSDREGTLPMKVCSPSGLYCPPPVFPPPANCGRFIVRASNGTFLGLAKSGTFAMDGVCNTSSNYGSTFSQTSIFNTGSPYGSTVSPLSAYNPNAFMPPELYCEGTMMRHAYVTKNLILSGRVDPDKLCMQLAAWFIF
jgi:hypothetical protein